MKNSLDSEYIVDLIWHWKVEDNLDWTFCSGILQQDENITISQTKLKNIFVKYFKDLTGVAPYSECPKCKNELIPKSGKYGRFIGCSAYPECNFIAGAPNYNRAGKTESEIQNEVNEILNDIGVSHSKCPKCGNKLVPRDSGRGSFVGCSSYPDCNFIARPKRKRRSKKEIQNDKEELKNKLLSETGVAPYTNCPECGKELIPRNGRFGMFVGCSGFPQCKFIASSNKGEQEIIEKIKATTGFAPDDDCPNCGSKLKICYGHVSRFLGCSNYPQCNFTARADKPTTEAHELSPVEFDRVEKDAGCKEDNNVD